MLCARVESNLYFHKTDISLDVYTISVKVLTPFLAIAILLSMSPYLATHQSAVLQRSNVNGIWQDLFGSDNQGVPDLLITSETPALTDIFLQISGIDGESTDDRHLDWIEVTTFSMSMSQMWSGGSDQLFMEDLVLVKQVDKATPKLMEKCVKFEEISSVVLEFCKTTGDKHTYYKYELSDVIVSSYHSSGSMNDIRPSETITLSFESMEVTYTEFDYTGSPKGMVEFSWDIDTGRSG